MPQPNLPPLPQSPPATNRLSMFGTVLRDLAGRTGGTGVRSAIDAARAQQEEARRQAEIARRQAEWEAYINTLPDRERAVAMRNPEEWTKNVAQDYAPANLNGAQTRRLGSGITFTAPLAVDHGGQYGWNTPGGYNPTGTAAASHADVNQAAQADATATNNDRTRDQADERLALDRAIAQEQARHNQEMEKLQRMRGSGSGGSGTAGAYNPGNIIWDGQ